MEDPDEIANTLVKEMNMIVEDIAPSRTVQASKRYQPWHTEETREILDEADKALSEAINYNDVEHWRTFRLTRNKAKKMMESHKKKYYAKRLTNTKSLWKELKQRGRQHNS